MTLGISLLWMLSIYAIIKALKKTGSAVQIHGAEHALHINVTCLKNMEKVEMEGDTGRQLWEKTNSFLNGGLGK